MIGHDKTDMGEGQPVLRSKDPEGVAQEMWALFAVYQAICQLIGAGVDAAGIPPDRISFPHARRRDRHGRGFPLTSSARPSPRSCSRSSCPASTFATAPTGPAPQDEERHLDRRKPGEPSVTIVTRRIELDLLQPWDITLKARPLG